MNRLNSRADTPRCETLSAAVGMTVGCILGGLLGRSLIVTDSSVPSLATTLVVLVFAMVGAYVGQVLCHLRDGRFASQ
jgi:hypothetical protein